METIPPCIAPSHNGSDKIWTILCHISAYLGFPIILPLVVYLAMRKESVFVADNAREALNFHISMLIYFICTFPLIYLLVGIPIYFALIIFYIVVSIIAAVKASDGNCYRYPLCIRFVS